MNDLIEESAEIINQRAVVLARRAALSLKISFEIREMLLKSFPDLKDLESIICDAIKFEQQHRVGCIVEAGDGNRKQIVDVDSLNEIFAVLEVKKNTCVIIIRETSYPISLCDFKLRVSGMTVMIGLDKKGNPKYVDAEKYWLGDVRKFRYTEIVFNNENNSPCVFNLFSGFGVKPKEGSCQKIIEHIRSVICDNCPVKSEAFFSLLAWQIQNIGKPSRVVTALKSTKHQAGKGIILGEVLAPIYGDSGFSTFDMKQITGRFNDTIRGKAFIFLDEALFSGDKKTSDVIKSLSTASKIGIESKGLPTVQCPIAVNLFLSTNHDEAAYIEEEDLRYFILECNESRVGDSHYFAELYDEISRGGREAFLYFLLNRDVNNFVPWRDVPKNNDAKNRMIKNSMNPYDARKWLEDCCDQQMIIGMRPYDDLDKKMPWEPWTNGTRYLNGLLRNAYVEWQKTVKSAVSPQTTNQNKFWELLTNCGLEMCRSHEGKKRELPDVALCIERLKTCKK